MIDRGYLLRNPAKWRSVLYVLNAFVAFMLVQSLLRLTSWSWDWTEERRYTLSDASASLLKRLPYRVDVEVYLSGDLPPSFRRLRSETAALLSRMQRVSRHRLSYRFIDPTAARSATARKAYMMRLAQEGVQPTQLSYQVRGKRIQKWIFPSAILRTPHDSRSLLLLKGDRNQAPDALINQSIESLEYGFMNALNTLTRLERPEIGLWVSAQHAERAQALHNELRANYQVSLFHELKQAPLLNAFDALVVAAPKRSFTKTEAYALDQFVMNGGALLCFLPGIALDETQLSEAGTLLMPHHTGLENLLFHYGTRIHTHLVEDMYCARYPVIAGQVGDQPQWETLPWPPFVVARNYAQHPITRNLESVLFQFTASLDTTAITGIRKTPLVWSSPYTRLRGTPNRIGLNEMKTAPLVKEFRAGPKILALLLEGQFRSPYANQLPILRHLHGIDIAHFQSQSPSTKLIVVASGTFPFSDRDPRTQQTLPLGLYWPENIRYGQSDFITQSIAYLLDEKGIISTRNRRVRLRPLDAVRASSAQYKIKWQALNIGFPLLCIALMALGRMTYRRTLYARK